MSTAGAQVARGEQRNGAGPEVAHAGQAALDVQGLTKRYGALTVVDDLSFRVRPGAVTGFLGPNGAGKTTTLRMVLGLARPSAGRSEIFGRPYHELDDPARTVGSSLEVSGFHPGRSGRNHLRALAAMARLPDGRVDEVLELVELTGAADRRAGNYSMGMRQRLALAATLLGDPQILVLDEPANGLDPQGIRWLRDFLRGKAAEGRTVLVSSHVLAEVAQTVDDVVVISRGRRVYEGPIASLVHHGAGDAVQLRAEEPERLAAALSAAGGEVRHHDGDLLVVGGIDSRAIAREALRQGVLVYELGEQSASLEEVFLELTGTTDAGVAS